jgi:hypothetical protein
LTTKDIRTTGQKEIASMAEGSARVAAVQDVSGTGCFIAKPRNKHEEKLLWLEGLEQAAREAQNVEENLELEDAVRALKAHLHGAARTGTIPANSASTRNDT